ncbi:hypothetical protein [Herminiimonas fonticola]|uniref:SIR2-like protein n=1 Tax=Herminiimonas fonticola TaxID=303380 RepID=A0A4R6G4X9_9BURK|nr:hypothetical protein [Herminiimonas fonticola]RBA23081.1 SIR2-like domain [Herminiimonas fonticola]TDN89477.1 hypothetical protein EV677_1534 [Herminiimonas fonticola]
MRVVVIGAGASLEESLRLGSPANLRPPLIRNFAKILWSDTNLALPQSLYDYMQRYLVSLGHMPSSNPLETFIALEELGTDVHIERFFEYAWMHRHSLYDGAWGDLMYGAVVNTLICLFPQNGFHENGKGWKPFTAYQALANKLSAGDLVVNLNYEPLFEMGAIQAGRQITYIPNNQKNDSILVAKPHGSINLIVESKKFWFSEPDIIGSIMSQGEDMTEFRGIIAPRYNKSYQQHPIAAKIFDAIRDTSPDSVTFWGVGFTNSDADLNELYLGWCGKASRISIIHPCPETEILDAEKLLHTKVEHYKSPEEWNI